ALAREILAHYAELTTGPRIAFFEALAQKFGPDPERLNGAIAVWKAAPSEETAAALHLASEPRRHELIRRLNLAPGGTAALVRMREDLIDAMDRRSDLGAVDKALICVEVALTKDIPGAIAPILTVNREMVEADEATTAVFYSISNCQRGLTGVSFGNFLIKQVAEEIARETPKLSTFVTLSPAPNFAQWLTRDRANEQSQVLSASDPAALANSETMQWWHA